jgi:hypothetical protein
VTFRQTDPLFAVDLADPANPKVASELKITGFSSYLHPWGQGELVGLGYAGDEQGLTSGLKLAVFDVSDPYDVTVKDSLPVDYDEAPALWDHRAVLTDPSRETIGFAAQSWAWAQSGAIAGDRLTFDFLVYHHDPETGFELRGSLRHFEIDWSDKNAWTRQADGDLRGLRLGDAFYVCDSGAVTVWDFDSLAQLTTVDLGR